MKNLRFVCAQPRLLYYAWQVEVMINNFTKHGINPNNIDVLIAWNPNDLTTSVTENVDSWNKLAEKYNSVRFFFYQDTRQQPIHYISSIRPNLLKQHWLAHPYLKDEAIYYHDCDAIFTKTPNFEKFLDYFDSNWYLSDTNHYINYDYIVGKGHGIYEKMCEIVGLDPIIPKLMRYNSGGAQYILKNIDHTFWEKVERDSETLFHEITQMNTLIQQTNPGYHELQIWCADMWAVLWNGWKLGHPTKVVPELNFSWATDPIEAWDRSLIFHNAGITCNCGRAFYKGIYQNELPYNISLESFNENKNSYNYVKEILETAKNSCLI
jgi:hypothetical protein